jgi:hypothetical protein
MRASASGLLFLSLFASICGPAGANADSSFRPRVVNGLYTSEYPTVGALLKGADGDSAGAWCTGTMIGCSTFLTAAHCVCDGVGTECQPGAPGAPDPAGYFVFLQHAGLFAVDRIAVRTDFDFPTGDVAVVTLAAPVTGIRPTPLQLSGSPAFGTAGTIVGFGRSGDGNGDYLLKRAGAVDTANCEPNSNTTLVCWNYEDPVGPPGADANTCNGDSGGPLFVAGACGAVIAGITSGGNSDECTPLDRSYDANVYTYRSYIQAAGGSDLGNVSCGGMPQVGEAGTVVEGVTDSLSASDTDDVHGFTLPAGLQEARFSMNGVDEGGADFDLYVKAGAPPTTSNYDCRAIGSGQTGYCAFAAPAAGDWYVLVRRAGGAGVYQATVTTIEPGVPGPGSGSGSCDDGNACTLADACVGNACIGTSAPDGTPCDDGTRCTGTDVCTAAACAGTAAPLAGCYAPDVSRGSSIGIRDSPNAASDALSWKWGKGGSPPSALGDPTVAATYELCVFDRAGGVPSIAASARVPAGGLWRATASGFKYTDKAAAQGGVKSMSLKTNGAGRTSISAMAKGVALATPALPLQQDPDVLVQLSNGGACWEAAFSVPAKNDPAGFKAKSD